MTDTTDKELPPAPGANGDWFPFALVVVAALCVFTFAITAHSLIHAWETDIKTPPPICTVTRTHSCDIETDQGTLTLRESPWTHTFYTETPVPISASHSRP